MGTSHFHQIPGLLRYVEILKPKSILEVGSGIGKWGFLCRDRLEFLEGRYDKENWRTRIYGIELFAGYRNPIWDYCYDSVWIGDALDLIDKAPSVDVALMADVLEHIAKDRGEILLSKLRQKAQYLLVSTPVAFFAGEGDDGRPGAGHVSFWDQEDFSEYCCITEDEGSTRFFLIDFGRKGGGSLVVESAERYPFGRLLRALVLKIAHRGRIPTGRFIAPRTLGRHVGAGT